MHTNNSLRDDLLAYMETNSFNYEPFELFEPVDYILNLGGKRLRPVLLLMAYNLYKEDIKPALPVAYAYEIFHNFSLVHDDIMDEAPLRRGKMTIHKKYDINTGILSGDVMLICAYEYLLKIEEKNLIPPIIKIFTQVAKEVCIGQQYDINFESSFSVTIPAYLKMIQYKTASLIAGAMQTGAILAKSTSNDTEHLYEFGKNLGIAFQLQDDILDTYGNPETFGKRIGGDIVQNKKTYLVLKALEMAAPQQKKTLIDLLSDTPSDEEQKINTVKALFDDLNIRTLANEVKEAYHKKALQHLKAINVSESKKDNLYKIAENLLVRIQ